MAETPPHVRHLSSASDLVTPSERIRAGFVAIALEKNRSATPTIAQARALHETAKVVGDPKKLADMANLRGALLTAAGLSEKALKYLAETDKDEAIRSLIEGFLEPAGDKFVDELVYRYMLTRGDAFGGEMRNLVGRLAQHRFIRTLVACLVLRGQEYSWQHSESKAWHKDTGQPLDQERSVRALHWERSGASRVLAFNVKVPLVDKNVDISILRTPPESVQAAAQTPEAYIALGELKGGIDPAGSDEHWKTANTTLSRIRSSFAGAQVFPATFFIGGAIVNSMASELWAQLTTGQLRNAANLTSDSHLTAMCQWLIDL